MSPRWSGARIADGIVLAGWAALFWYLLLADRIDLFLSSRTAWVVPVGAAVLTFAAAGRLATARTPEGDALTSHHALRLGAIALPVVLVLALPPTSLGSYAASRRSSFVAAPVGPAGAALSSGPLTLATVAAAIRSPEGGRVLARRAGTEVTFTGFVIREPGMRANQFMLTRFLISCCVADALTVQVRVVGAPAARFRREEWVRVRGRFYPVGEEIIVAASEVERVARPKRPYLTT